MPSGIYQRTEEHKRKISLGNKGRIVSEATRKKISVSHKGLKHLEESKEKIRKAHKNLPNNGFKKGNKINLGRKLSEGTIRKIVEKNKGKKRSKEYKEKYGRIMKEWWSNPKNRERMKIRDKKHSEKLKGRKHPPEFGKKIVETRRKNNSYNHSIETKNKMSSSMTKLMSNKLTRENLSNKLKGRIIGKETRIKMSISRGGNGISITPYPEEWKESLKESIRLRDKYTCLECGLHQDELVGRFKKLDVHHVDYDKDNLNPDNLITLCKSCHIKTNVNRTKWIEYFKRGEFLNGKKE